MKSQPLSDASVLTEVYDWSPVTLANRYHLIAHACVTLLVVVYAAALFSQAVTVEAPPRTLGHVGQGRAYIPQ